jgi:hypothetical protein
VKKVQKRICIDEFYVYKITRQYVMEYGNAASQQRTAVPEIVRAKIIEAVAGIRFGAVEIIIHEGKVVQIERKERVRLDK